MILARGLCHTCYERARRRGGLESHAVLSPAEVSVIASTRSSALREAQRETNPHVIGDRTLLAKTCTYCGELLPGSAFTFAGHRARIGACTLCKRRRDYEVMMQNNERRTATRKRARLTAKRSAALPKPRCGYLWTGPEMEIIERDDLTARQAAVMIGRSLSAVYTMRYLIRREPKFQRVLGAQS